jgi:hypothetical protein
LFLEVNQDVRTIRIGISDNIFNGFFDIQFCMRTVETVICPFPCLFFRCSDDFFCTSQDRSDGNCLELRQIVRTVSKGGFDVMILSGCFPGRVGGSRNIDAEIQKGYGFGGFFWSDFALIGFSFSRFFVRVS